METHREQELLRRAKTGDSEAFGKLMDETLPMVMGLVMKLVRNKMDAEDITQEVYIRVFKHLRSFRGDARFSSWVSRIAINQTYKHIRKWRRNDSAAGVDEAENVVDHRDDQFSDILEREQRELLRRFIADLPEKQRAVVILRVEQNLPFQEIARVMKRSLGAVKANFFHGVNKIRVAAERSNRNGMP